MPYFYGHEAEQYAFYRIPKVLISDPRFRNVSTDAKLLYGLMLDRLSLSVKNGWLDNHGRVYIFFVLDEIQELLQCGHEKAVKLLGKEKKEKKKSQVDEAVELVFQDMENRMKTVMGTKVNISRKDKSKGKIEIEYYSEAELERLVELIDSIQPV